MDDHAALKDALEESTLLINATSVGMVPDVTGTVIPDKTLFHPELTVADVVYEPRETRLLREAREAGCPTFNGMYMLLHQGVKAFHIWTGLDMPVEIVREKYPSAYDCARKVADYLERKYGNQTSDSELLYLTLPINCLISKNTAKEETW